MSFYSNLAATASRLLAQFGQDVALERVTPEDYDVASGTAAAPGIEQVFKGALFDFDRGVTQVRGALVQADDKRMLLEAAALPTLNDTVRAPAAGGTSYRILSIGSVNPAGEPVIYDLHLRA